MNIDRVLIAWGRFANSRIGTEYPCIAAGMKLAVMPLSRYSMFNLTDEACFSNWGADLKIEEKQDLRYEILMARYALRIEDVDICKILNISRATYFNELAKAKSYIEGAIDSAKIDIHFL